MKKLLAVLMVMSIATVANAGLTMTGAPQGPIGPSDNVVFGINAADYQDPIALMGWIIIEGPGSFGNVEIEATVWEASYAQHMLPATLAEYTPLLVDYGYPNVVDIIEFEVKDLTEPFTAPSGEVIGNLVYHCEGIGDVTLTLCDIDLAVWETTIVNQIPEPMTLSLLGLGGLLLRRRK